MADIEKTLEEQQNMILDWDDEISGEGNEYVVLPEGDYVFKVIGFERGRYIGSAKIPPCNKAIITVQVNTIHGPAICKFDLILFRTLEWKLCSFFRSIGQKKHDEPLKMDWNKVQGSYGLAHFKPRSYETNSGEQRTVNDIDRFLDYNEEFMTNFKFDEALYPTQDGDLPF